jgi:hypothetical protein
MSSEEIWVDPPDDGPDKLLGVGHCCLLEGGIGRGGWRKVSLFVVAKGCAG